MNVALGLLSGNKKKKCYILMCKLRFIDPPDESAALIKEVNIFHKKGISKLYISRS